MGAPSRRPAGRIFQKSERKSAMRYQMGGFALLSLPKHEPVESWGGVFQQQVRFSGTSQPIGDRHPHGS
jgi:hypothetical protein